MAANCRKYAHSILPVLLDNSGLGIILGCMAYGPPKRFPRILPEEDSFKRIKAACVSDDFLRTLSTQLPRRYDASINTFDTANARIS
ncbi:hypothetical protein F5887DRAFT_968918 [Amanita rubescens]|nr:hypothetical protein F5887DRAFT_968918 [Amanita rubescens]